MEPLVTTLSLETLIQKATAVVGSQRKLAELLGIAASNLVEMKQGKRPCNWRVRGGLRAIAGEEPARAFMTAMVEDLSKSENEDEKKAADGVRAMLAAFPEDWRKRNEPNQRAGLVTRLFLWAIGAHWSQAWSRGTQHA